MVAEENFMHSYADRFRFVQLAKLVLILCVLSVLCVNISAQDWKTVADGVEYAEVRREFSGKPVNINLLRLDLTKVRLDVHHAMDAAIGTEKTSSIATRHGAFAAINSGFFRLDTSIWAGDAASVIQIDGRLLSEFAFPRMALLISNDYAPIEVASTINLSSTKGQKYFAILEATEVQFEVLESVNKLIIGKQPYVIAGINRERKENEMILFTPEFGRTTLTDQNGLEIVVQKNRILAVRDSVGSSDIPMDGYVISVTGSQRDVVRRSGIKQGQKIALDVQTMRTVSNHSGNSWKTAVQVEDIVAGVPQLIKNGKIDITWEQEKASKSFVETRHPRTAVAKLKDGKFLMLTADGRSDVSAGLDLYDLAKYMLELGAVDAMNLDGGGSTTMFLDGKVVNKPSDKEGERKVGDAILVTLRKPKRK